MAEGISIGISLSEQMLEIVNLTSQVKGRRVVLATQRAVNEAAKQTKTASSMMIRETIDLPAKKVKRLIRVEKSKGARDIEDIEAAIDFDQEAVNASGFKKTVVTGEMNPRTRKKKKIGVKVHWRKDRGPQYVRKGFVMAKKGERIKKKQVFIRTGPAQDAIKSIFGPKLSDIAKERANDIRDDAQANIAKLLPRMMEDEIRRIRIGGFKRKSKRR